MKYDIEKRPIFGKYFETKKILKNLQKL